MRLISRVLSLHLDSNGVGLIDGGLDISKWWSTIGSGGRRLRRFQQLNVVEAVVGCVRGGKAWSSRLFHGDEM